MQIGFLTCPGTHPGSPVRRVDAFEHDLQVDALRPALAQLALELVEIDWRAPLAEFTELPLILIGTPWDYQDSEASFLSKLDALEAAGHTLCNPAAMVRWNARKTYLRGLELRGVSTIPTVWIEQARACDIDAAFEKFGSEAIVVKRQVGAGAEGQSIHHPGETALDWQMDRPAMLQPFLRQIAIEGEYSFLFVDGAFSHALLKRPTGDDYRVQSLYGGTEHNFDPSGEDIASASAVVDAIPFPTPLYARIDMVRADEGQLLLMEAELIEPYLYPEQAPDFGAMMAHAIQKRLGT